MDLTNKLSFKGGFADITPVQPMPLAGYASRQGDFTRVDGGLEANIIVVSDGSHRSIIVSADLLYIGRELRDSILSSLDASINRSELFIAASHTHFAPATDSTKPMLGKMNPDYVRFAGGRIAEAINKLVSDGTEEVDACYVRTSAPDISVNRRKHGRVSLLPPKVDILPNVDGFKDPSIHLIKFVAADKRTVGMLWSYGCHPVGFHEANSVSPDFPGDVRGAVRKQFGASIPVIFLQGVSGDVRPYLGQKIDGKPRFTKFSEAQWGQWVGSLEGSVMNAIGTKCDKALSPAVKNSEASIPLRDIGLSGVDEPVIFHAVDIGNVKIIGVTAELVAEYATLFSKHFPNSSVIPVGCLGHTYGYLPTGGMLREDEYEVTGFQKYFGLEGRFAPDLDEKVKKLLESLG